MNKTVWLVAWLQEAQGWNAGINHINRTIFCLLKRVMGLGFLISTDSAVCQRRSNVTEERLTFWPDNDSTRGEKSEGSLSVDKVNVFGGVGGRGRGKESIKFVSILLLHSLSVRGGKYDGWRCWRKRSVGSQKVMRVILRETLHRGDVLGCRRSTRRSRWNSE